MACPLRPEFAGALYYLAPAATAASRSLSMTRIGYGSSTHGVYTQTFNRRHRLLATIDELGELGLLSKQLQSELKECMVLAPQAITGMGWACSGQ